MRKFFALLKVSVQALLLTSTNVGKGRRKKAATGVGAMLIIGFVGLYMSGVYSFMLMGTLAPVGMEVLVFVFMGLAALVGGLLFTTLAVKGVVFGGKDNDLLLSMPVSPTLLMISRVLAIYIEELVFAFFVLLPAGVACAVFTRRGVSGDPLFWLRLLIASLYLSLLSTTLSVALGAAMAFLSTKISKGKVLGQNIMMGLFLAGIFWFSFNINGLMGELAANAAGIKESLGWAAPILWMGDGILGSWPKLLAFMACCAVPFLLMAFVLGRVYRKAVTAFGVRGATGGYKLTGQTAAGLRMALFKKEAKRFFGTPMYFWNAGLGLIMTLVLGVAALVKSGDLREVLAALSAQGAEAPVMPLAAAAVIFCVGTCCITAPSFSLEGKYFWILREAPVDEMTLIWIKTGFQLLLTWPCGLICTVCLWIALGLSPAEGIGLVLAVLVFTTGHACFGTLMGLTFPKMDAPNETVVVKQSMPVMFTMFVPWGMMLVAVLLYWVGGLLAPAAALALPAALLAGVSALCAGLLYKRGPDLVREL